MDINDRFNVVLTLDIQTLRADGTTAPFDLTVKTMYDCPRAVMHAIETAIAEALVELGDQGVVLLGGDAAAAQLEAQKAVKAKVRGQGKEKDKADDKFAR
jgi:hypothetical protein